MYVTTCSPSGATVTGNSMLWASVLREDSDGHLLNSSLHGSRWFTDGSIGPEGSLLIFVVIALMMRLAFDRVYREVQYSRGGTRGG